MSIEQQLPAWAFTPEEVVEILNRPSDGWSEHRPDLLAMIRRLAKQIAVTNAREAGYAEPMFPIAPPEHGLSPSNCNAPGPMGLHCLMPPGHYPGSRHEAGNEKWDTREGVVPEERLSACAECGYANGPHDEGCSHGPRCRHCGNPAHMNECPPGDVARMERQGRLVSRAECGCAYYAGERIATCTEHTVICSSCDGRGCPTCREDGFETKPLEGASNMDIIGKKAEPDEQDLIDRDLASPQFVSWSARREVRHLRDIVRTLPEMNDLLPRAEQAVELLDGLDDAIDARMSWRSG